MRAATISALLVTLAAGAARADDIEVYLGAAMRKAQIPGLAYAVVQGGRRKAMQVMGEADIEWKSAVTPRTAFQIASATKLFTGTLLMGYVEEGRLRLDDPVTRWLPDAPPAWKGITVRHLATHTSGLAREAMPDHTVPSLAEGVKRAMAAPMASQPGERAEYGSPDFTVLQYVLETVGGEPYPELVRKRVLARAGMDCTRFENATEQGLLRAADVIPQRATTFRTAFGKLRRLWFLYPQHTYAAGGLFSCIEDMERFLIALQSGKLLKPETLRAMWTAPKLKDGTTASFGIGWTVSRYRGRRAVGHSGGPALGDVLYFPDDKLGIVVLTNQQILIPVLAEGVADTLLPAPPFLGDKGIADNAPALTEAVRRLLAGMAEGKLDPALFPAADAAGAVAELNVWGPVSVGLHAPLARLVLLEDAPGKDGGRARTYRAVFGGKTVRYRVVFTADGKIADHTPVDE